MLSFQAANSAVMSRALKRPELLTVALTAVYVDFFADRRAFSFKNSRRNGLGSHFLLWVSGAAVGAYVTPRAGLPSALFVAVALKAFGTIMWCFVPEENVEVDEEQGEAEMKNAEIEESAA